MKNLIIGLALLTLIEPVWAHRKPCPPELLKVPIAQLIPTQSGLRRTEPEMEARRVYIRSQARLPKPAIIFRTPDGRLFIRDGHHDIHLAGLEGMTELNSAVGDFVFEEWTEEEFFEVNLAAGWVTPMTLGEDFRRAELAGWKWLLEVLKSHRSPEEIEAFVRAHPEAYLVGGELDSMTPEHLGMRTREEYQLYLEKMDLTMPMKIGQLLPAFPSSGILLDNGFGTGQQSFAYALYNPDLLVVGQDIAADAVEHAAANFQLPNLLFLRNDVLASAWPDNMVDAVVESSFTHEVFSYGSPALDLSRVERMRSEAFRQLKPGGTYGMRDFVRPDWPSEVVIELPTHARSGPPPYGHLSLAELFLDHAKTHINPEFSFREIEASQVGYRAFVLEAGFASNFLLRINYTNETSWSSERAEQYVYASAEENIQSFRRKGFRVDFAAPIENHWMIRNWWEKEGIRIRSLQGEVLDYPPSNFILYATKPFGGEPVAIRVAKQQEKPRPQWMQQQTFASASGRFDLIRVPGETHVFVPFEKADDGIFVWVRRNVSLYGQRYYQDLSDLNSAYYEGFGAAALAKVASLSADPMSLFAQSLRQKTGGHIPESAQSRIRIETMTDYLASPGGTDEVVRTQLVDMKGSGAPLLDHLTREMKRVKLDHLLAASHLGAINDPRLELAAYELARGQGMEFFPWIGPRLNPVLQTAPPLRRLETLLSSQPQSGIFTRSSEAADFLSVRDVEFEKEFGDGSVEETRLEFVLPKHQSVDTYGVIPCMRTEEGVVVGLEQRNLPSYQLRFGESSAPVIPAWRLPRGLDSRRSAREHLERRMKDDFGLVAHDLLPLGEGYFPSSGQTPEKFSLHYVEVDSTQPFRDLQFVKLEELLQKLDLIRDLHTRLAVLRLAHALGKI